MYHIAANRVFSKHIVVLCSALCICLCSYAQTTPPNIIVIVADDLNDHIAVNGVSPNIETPNIDLIAGMGTVFLNAYAAAPLCAPSRTAFLTGKDADYTHVYKNADKNYNCKDFELNFTEAEGNAFYITLPGYFKDSLNYYTYNLNKIFHCHKNYIGYDDDTPEPCEKTGMWNNYFYYDDSLVIDVAGAAINQGVTGYDWAALPDSMESYMTDYIATDSAIAFLQRYSDDPASACNKPFLMMLGYTKPHKKQYIPEKYFLDDYVPDVSADGFDIPYNYPPGSRPRNGIELPPQPAIPNSDLDAFPEGSMSRVMVKNVDSNFIDFANDMSPLPELGLSEEETRHVVEWSQKANGAMAYYAAVKFVDAQVGRLYSELAAHPEILNNTIIVVMGDHGYSLGQKRHWGKYAMWETDVRTAFTITDFRNTTIDNTSLNEANLIDLFPTLLDLVGVTYPTFPDSTYYFDGKSLIDQLQPNDLHKERPLVSSIETIFDDHYDGSCFPQYGIRNQRFHMIQYRTNGGGMDSCIAELSTNEYELYDIGAKRETDPYEWKNLAADPDYLPAMQYLMQYLPDSSRYLQAGYSILIDNPEMCLLPANTVLDLGFDLYDKSGVATDTASGCTIMWTNNVVADTLYGDICNYDLNTWPDALLDTLKSFFIYCSIVDTTQNDIVGFDMKRIYLENSGVPTVDFTPVLIGASTVVINDFEITGDFNDYWWDYGNGPELFNTVPGPFTYDTPGAKSITAYVTYGNNDSCVVITTNEIEVPTSVDNTQMGELVIVPNPASDVVTLMINNYSQFEDIRILNMVGEIVMDVSTDASLRVIKLNVSHLASGVYYICSSNPALFEPKGLVVARNK